MAEFGQIYYGYNEAFAWYDKNEDGKLDKEELTTWFQQKLGFKFEWVQAHVPEEKPLEEVKEEQEDGGAAPKEDGEEQKQDAEEKKSEKKAE